MRETYKMKSTTNKKTKKMILNKLQKCFNVTAQALYDKYRFEPITSYPLSFAFTNKITSAMCDVLDDCGVVDCMACNVRCTPTIEEIVCGHLKCEVSFYDPKYSVKRYDSQYEKYLITETLETIVK